MNSYSSELPRNVSLVTRDRPECLCPNCQAAGMHVFYEVDAVPVHSCLLIGRQDQALGYPTGPLQLSLCRACGFISNTAFDPSVHHYSAQYEETQGFSGRFRAFSHGLCGQLIDRYDIRGKRILEIGCGKGEFLAEICSLGHNTGIGIDPAYVAERNPAEEASSITFIQDFYSEEYAYLEADVVCCRHTLEHIHETYRFLKTIRNAIGDRTDTLVIFEVPETLRVLREGAFWDIYYEHCSYFTPASLIHVFDAAGFDVDRVDLIFDDQYILLAAYPRSASRKKSTADISDTTAVEQAVADFNRACRTGLAYWKDVIETAHVHGKRIVAWGGGSKAVAFLTTLALGDTIECVVDINPYKQGQFLPGTGQEMVSPASLRERPPDQIIVMNPIYCDEIARDLARLGVDAELIPVTSFVQA